MAPHIKVNAPLVAFLAAASLALTTPAALAQGNGGGKGGGGHTTASTNLSYPAVFTATPVTVNGLEGLFTLGGTLSLEYSYGCNIPEEEFPNTSCIKPDGTFMTLAECQTYTPCQSATEFSRIYWQRESPVAVWQAESLAAADTDGDLGNYGPDAGYFVVPTPATHVDWGDNMESQTWTASSVIRVETTTFTTLPMMGAEGIPLPGRTMRGFQMWHVSGKGPDELWGVRATEPGEGAQAHPYVYDSPYAIIHAPNVHLSFTKLDAGGTTCPSSGNAYPSPFTSLVWDEASDKWGTTDPASGGFVEHGCVWNDLKYTVELNIGGKFVHGYNWQTSRMPPTICTISGANWTKDGWWRLTYHNAADAVAFSAFVATVDSLKPPPALAVGPAPATLLAAEEEEGDTGPLYTPVVDTVNNLTYIDICLKPGRGGGGRR